MGCSRCPVAQCSVSTCCSCLAGQEGRAAWPEYMDLPSLRCIFSEVQERLVVWQTPESKHPAGVQAASSVHRRGNLGANSIWAPTGDTEGWPDRPCWMLDAASHKHFRCLKPLCTSDPGAVVCNLHSSFFTILLYLINVDWI